MADLLLLSVASASVCSGTHCHIPSASSFCLYALPLLGSPLWVSPPFQGGSAFFPSVMVRNPAPTPDDESTCSEEPPFRIIIMASSNLMAAWLRKVEAVRNVVKQILPQDIHRKHRRTDSSGSTTSSRSNTSRDDIMGRINTQKARSQLLETHLAKLFKQKMEIFLKVEHTQESVLNTVMKFCLKSMQEFARLQTFKRRGFQQIQLDMEFLRGAIRMLLMMRLQLTKY